MTTIRTDKRTKDTCLLSDLPILAGLYDLQGKTGVYFEVYIQKMVGIIAIGEFICNCHAGPFIELGFAF